ncbi:MAG: hypothetical protein WA996_22415 [Candidatus Promineifilaceae bacterium]
MTLPSVEKAALFALEESISRIIGEKETVVGKAYYLSRQMLPGRPRSRYPLSRAASGFY